MIKRIAAALTAAAVLLLTACTDKALVQEQGEQIEITLSWWGNDKRNEYTLEAVKLFEQKHPEIKVKCSYSEWSGYEARSKVQMMSGTEADVMQINVGWLSQYSADGKGYYDIDKLGEYVDLSNFDSEILEYGRRSGVLNAIPIAMNAETLYVNKTVYEKYGLAVPKTWDELFEAAKVMSKDGVYPVSGANKSIWLFCIAYAEQKNGKHFFNENSEITFGKEDLKMMIELYTRFVNEGVMPKIEDYQRYNIDNGTYASTVAWVSDAVNYNGAAMEAGFDIMPAAYPTDGACESGTGWYAKPATLYAISKNTQHPKEAAMLLDFMLNSPEWAELQGVEKGIPLSDAVRDHLKEIGQLEGIQYDASLVMEENEYISPMNSLIENTDLFDAFFDCCNQVIFEKTTADDAAQQLYDKLKEGYTVVG